MLNNGRMTFTVYGNCQAAAIAKLLASSSDFGSRYSWSRLEPCHEISPDEMDQWRATNGAKTKLLITQCLKPGWRKDSRLDIDHLIASMPASVKIITWQDIYYRGYSPELIYPRIFKRDSLSPYTNIIAEFGFVQGLKPDLLADIHSDPAFFEREFVESIHATAANELDERERQSQADIRLASYMRTEWSSRRLFHTFNHPTRQVLVEASRQICTAIEISAPPKLEGPELFAGTPPALASFAAALHEPEETTFRLFGRDTTCVGLYEGWYDHFSSVGRSKVQQDLESNLKTYTISRALIDTVSTKLGVSVCS